jgi:competence protein ComEC
VNSENQKSPAENQPISRPLAPVVLALLAGIASPAWGLNLPEKWLAPALALLWAALALIWWARRRTRLLPLIFFWLLGVACYQQALHPVFSADHLVTLPQGEELAISGRLQRPAKAGTDRVQLFMAARAWLSPQGWQTVAGRLLVSASSLEPPPVGTDLVVKGRLRTPQVLRNPGTFDRVRFLATDGIFRQMRLREGTEPVFLAETAGLPLGERLRGGIRQLLKRLPPTLRAIYLSMLLGDQGEVTPAMRRNLARTGTSHLLVVNGLHLGMVAAVIFFLSSWLMRRSAWLLLRINVVKVATLLAATAVVGYAWVAGGSPSTQRAEVMVLAYLLLVFLGRPRELWSALCLAALIILSLSPLRLFSISFQLSFTAVVALIYLMPRLLKMGQSFDQALGPGVVKGGYLLAKEWGTASAVATLATAPLVAAYFQVVSLLGIVVNLVAIPLVLLLALPLGEAAVLSQAVHLTSLAQGFLFLGQWPLWLGWQAICLGAVMPGSAIIVAIPTWLQIVLYYLLLILIFAPRSSLWTWSTAGLAGAALAVTVAWPMMSPPGS